MISCVNSEPLGSSLLKRAVFGGLGISYRPLLIRFTSKIMQRV
jgi:hypothetical protein